MKPILKKQNPNYQKLPEVWGVQVLPLPGCSPALHLPLMCGRLVTAKTSPFSAHQCPIKKYGDGILEEVDGFTPQLAEGAHSRLAPQEQCPVPTRGTWETLHSLGLLGPSACHLPSEMQTALQGCRESKNAVQDENYVELGDFWLHTLQVSNTSSKTRIE